jgi:hypothetical protein
LQKPSLVSLGLIALVAQVPLSIDATGCPFEMFNDSPHLRIFQSPWTVDAWGQACGMGVSGGMEIRAINSDTHESRTVATFGDIIIITMSSDEPNSLTINLPNLVEMTEAATQIGDVNVTYKFEPYDDPEARANFQKWKRHPDDPQAREWYCRNIFAKMDASNRTLWNAVMGNSYPADHGAGHGYCPDH